MGGATATPTTARASSGAGAAFGGGGRVGRHSRGTSADLRAAAGSMGLPRQGSGAGSGLGSADLRAAASMGLPRHGSGAGSGLGSALSSPTPGRTPRHSRTRSIEAAAALAGEPQRPAYRTAVLYGVYPQ